MVLKLSGVLLYHKDEKRGSFVGKWIHLEAIMSSEINKIYKLKCHIVSLT